MREVERFYDKNPSIEWKRLEKNRIEFDMTKKYLNHFLKPGSKILDVGGGPGRYAIYLSEGGHEVSLVDLSSKNLELAKEKAEENGITLRNYIHANALNLSETVEGMFDAVLCFGPLYHLVTEDDREKAIGECLKRLNPGGLLFTAFISAFAPINDCVTYYPKGIIGYKDQLINYTKDGVNIVSKDNPGFTTAYFIDPMAITPLMEKFEIETLAITGLEGLLAQTKDAIMSLPDEAYDEWLDLNFQLATNPVTWAGSEHMLHIGRKK